MMLLVRHGFGFNTNLFETNVLNLAVVVRLVIKFVGDALQILLDQRRQSILSSLEQANQKRVDAKKRLENARKSVETARLRSQEICLEADQIIEQERLVIKQQLKEDLKRLQEMGNQTVQLERQRITQLVIKQVVNQALEIVKNTLLTTFKSKGISCSRQKKLNEVHVRKTFPKLKKRRS